MPVKISEITARFPMNKNTNRFLFIIICALILSGCAKKENFPIIPEIGFLDYENEFGTGQYAVRGILTFSYQDGDGDIGLTDAQTNPPYNIEGDYYYNLVVTYYEKLNGAYQKLDLPINPSSRIPWLSAESNRAIKGTITDTLILDPNPSYDTLKIEVFIYDRALHKSNVISTPDIILRKP
jgi:hypothetical protein